MKKILLLIIFAIISTLNWAAKAWNTPIIVTQPDGTTLSAYLHGDEHFNWYTTADGVILYRTDNVFYVAEILTDGTIIPTTQIAHEKDTRRNKERSIIARQDKEKFFNRGKTILSAKSFATRSMNLDNSSLFPHMGSPKAVVILAQYSDTPFTIADPRRSFNQFLNGEGQPTDFGHGESKNRSSVRQYFKDMSFGKFTPQFDVYGPVTLSHPLAYYGGTNDKGSDERFRDLIIEACQLMDDSLDFSQYDSNNDGQVDLVYVIYAGYGQNMGAAPNTMWPKAGSIGTPHQTQDGKRIIRAGISNELLGNETWSKAKWISCIGLFCHEFSHCLGLPDFYPTLESATGNNQGMEAWSLMDDGEYTANGWCPTAYTAWEREAFGWITIDTLTSAGQVALTNIDENGKAYRIMNDQATNGNEYYIIQNIQPRQWNKGLKSHGMLVYHVNYDATAFSLSSNNVNNIKGKPRMTVVPADGTLLSSFKSTRKAFEADIPGDLFPGTSNVTALTDESNLVNYAPWTGGNLNKPIYNIREENNIVYFDFMEKVETGIESTPSIIPALDHHIYSIDGRYVGTNEHILPKGIYIRNKQKFVIK